MPTTYYLRWAVPAANANSVPQQNSLVLGVSPHYTPVNTVGGGMEQATETFQPSFARTAQTFARGQRVHQFPLTLERRHRDYAAANLAKFQHLKNELPPSDVAVSLYMNSVGPQSGVNSWGLLNCVLKSARWIEQHGPILTWSYVFEGGNIEIPATTSYPASAAGLILPFNS